MPEFNGTAQRDSLEGWAGVDTLSGRDGSDTLLGGAGDDLIYGDRGDDTLSGGAGADIFASFAEAGLDRVIDFNRAEGDRVRMDAGSAFTVSQQGADTVVEVAGGARVVLVGVTLAGLDTGWIFVG